MKPKDRLYLSGNFLSLALCAAGLIFSFWLFAPGVMTFDTQDQYNQAVSGQYHDWYPPFLAWAWSKLNLVAAGPQNMLLVQLILFWAALYTFVALFTGRARYLFLLLPAFPWVINYLGLVLKDSLMAFCWLLAIGLLANAERSGRWRLLLVGAAICMTLLGILMRLNALPAALPLLFYAVYVARSTGGRLSAAAISMAMAAAMVGGAVVFASHVAHATKTYPQVYVMYDDLHALSLASGRNLYQGIMPVADESIAVCKDVTLGVVQCYPGNLYLLRDKYSDLAQLWRSSILKYPFAFAAHKLRAFWALLAPSKPGSAWLYNLGAGPEDEEYEPAWMKAMRSPVDFAPVLYMPLLWLFFGISLLTYAVRQHIGKLRPVTITLLTSAVLYMLTYLPATVATDFRYVYWSVLATTAAFFIAMLEHLEQRRLSWHTQSSARYFDDPRQTIPRDQKS